MKKLLLVTAISSIVLMSGCASTGDQSGSMQNDYESELNARNKEIETLKQQLGERQSTTTASASMDSQQATHSSASLDSSDLLPPNAKAGQCFARVYTPPTYRTEAENVLKADGYDVVEIIPAVYGTETQTVMTEEATEVVELVPAVYGWKEEQVLVSPEITELAARPCRVCSRKRTATG